MNLNRRSFLALSGSAALFGLRASAAPETATASAAPVTTGSVADIVRAGVAEKMVHGCVCCRGDGSGLTVDGLLRFYPENRPMCAEARFDLASVTKTFVAITAAELAAAGKLDVDAPFTTYLTKHVLAKENCRITVRDLATHSGGFGNDKRYELPRSSDFFKGLWAKRPKWGRGEKFCYACSNLIYLGLIVEKVTGLPLDVAVQRTVMGPLGMTKTCWGPIGGDPTAAQMEMAGYRIMPGAICDPTARGVPFPIGNAGLFSTAPDLAVFADALATGKVFSPKALELVRTPTFEKNGARRSFGFDMSAEHRPAGLSDKAIYHGGSSGQTLCADPGTGFSAVVLTNRYGNRYAQGKVWRNVVVAALKQNGGNV